MCMCSNWASILHTSVGGWAPTTKERNTTPRAFCVLSVKKKNNYTSVQTFLVLLCWYSFFLSSPFPSKFASLPCQTKEEREGGGEGQEGREIKRARPAWLCPHVWVRVGVWVTVAHTHGQGNNVIAHRFDDLVTKKKHFALQGGGHKWKKKKNDLFLLSSVGALLDWVVPKLEPPIVLLGGGRGHFRPVAISFSSRSRVA